MLLRVAFILFVHDQLPVAASTTTGMISHTNPGTMSSASQPLPVARARAAYLLIALLLMQDVVLMVALATSSRVLRGPLQPSRASVNSGGASKLGWVKSASRPARGRQAVAELLQRHRIYLVNPGINKLALLYVYP